MDGLAPWGSIIVGILSGQKSPLGCGSHQILGAGGDRPRLSLFAEQSMGVCGPWPEF